MEVKEKLFKSGRFIVVLLVLLFICYEYGSLILKNIVEAVQVTTDADVWINGTGHLQSGSQTVFIDDQTGYKFFRDGPGYCVYRKTTNGGTTWSSTTTVDAQTDCINIQVWYDKWTPGSASSSIHIATIDTGADDAFYNRLDPGADTLLKGTAPATTSLTQGGAIAEGVNTVSITRGTDGTIYIGTINTTDAFVVKCAISCGTAASWSEAGIPSHPFGLSGNYAILLPLTGGTIMAIQRDITAEDMTSRIWNNTTATWTATTTFDASATDNTTYDVGMAAMVSSTTPGKVYLAYIASSTVLGVDDEIRTAIYSGGSWSQTGKVLTGSSTLGITNLGLSLDSANDNVYVAYSGQTATASAASGNVWWKWATSSMMNWSVPRGPLLTTANDVYGVDLNGITDQRIYASWFVNTGDDIIADTIADIAPSIIASSTGTHANFLVASTTNNYVGGAFVLTENFKSDDVTGITITETGTIDASLYINNIKLKYEMDTTYPYDCTSVSYDGTETQFGATSTGGFSSANGTSTFSGSTVTVSTTSAMCVYPVMDLLFSPIATTTLKITINNPSTDISVSSGVAAAPNTSQSMVSSSSVYTNALTQVYYHWRNDNGTEVGASSATGGLENTALLNVAQTLPYRLRIEVSNKGGTTTGPYQYRLEYGKKVSTCSAVGTWTDVGASLGEWSMATSSQLTDAADTTNIATSTGGVSNDTGSFLTPNGGQEEATSQTGNITLTVSQYVELEYAVKARASSTEGATYCFKVTNAGTALPVYTVYPEATIKYPTDFKVQRGFVTITSTSTTLVAGVDYVAPNASTSAFIRITNTQLTGAGDSSATASQLATNTTAYIVDPSNIMKSVTFARGFTNNTRVAWEIVEYTGVAGGENEIIVRNQGTLTYGAASSSATTSAIAGIVTDADVAVFITGQFNPAANTTDYNAGLSTSKWNASTDTASFWRGEATGAVITSYAIVEFTGSNWVVQRTNDHQYAAAGVTETENIIAVGSITKAFVHAQKRVGLNLNTHANYGHEVVLSGINQVSFRLDPAATTPTQQFSVAWVIENTQTVGDFMVVSRSNATSTGGTAPLTTIVDHGVTVDDLSVTSLFINNRASGALTTFPEPMIAARMISNSQYELWMSNTGGNRVFFAEVVEWPTARRKITQNDYQLYASSTALLPTDPWSAGGTINLGENTEMTGLDDPMASGHSVRIRMSLNITSAAMIPGVDSFKLQFAPRPTPSCTAISSTAWSSIGNIGSTTAPWRATSTPLTDGTVLSTDPYTPGDLVLGVSDVAGTFEEENNTASTPYQVNPGEDVEYDWAIEDNGATDKTSYCFRMVESDGTLLTGYNDFPTIRTIGYGAQSQDWQWFDDAENANPTTTLAATNTAPIDIDYNNAITLRLTLREINGAPKNNAKFRLQFSEFSSFSTSTNVDEISSCNELSYWCYTDGGGTDNATITAKRMGDADSCSGGVGNGCGTYNEFGTSTSVFTHKAKAATEFSFTIKNNGARVNRVYYFRAYDVASGEDVPLGSSEVYPSLVTKGASLVFTMTEVATSTSVEGIVTDFRTTPTTIPFGSLVASTSREGAQHLTIDTNGTQGYRILMMLTSDLQTSGGSVMQNVTGTNAVPTSWSTGCATSATSCFGYHAGDDTLQGGSNRFAAPDTYAGFSTTTPEEIAYISQPAIGDATDIVFRLMTRNLQSAGQYQARVMYISIPVF